MHKGKTISVTVDKSSFQHVGTWRGPSGRIKLIFTDGHEEIHDVPGRGEGEFVVRHSGTLQDVHFASNDDPYYWYHIGLGKT